MYVTSQHMYQNKQALWWTSWHAFVHKHGTENDSSSKGMCADQILGARKNAMHSSCSRIIDQNS